MNETLSSESVIDIENITPILNSLKLEIELDSVETYFKEFFTQYFDNKFDLLNSMEIENLIQKERVEFVLDFSEIDEINSIKSYIYSIFYNLISNSIKYKQLQVNPVIKIKSSLIDKQIVDKRIINNLNLIIFNWCIIIA